MLPPSFTSISPLYHWMEYWITLQICLAMNYLQGVAQHHMLSVQVPILLADCVAFALDL